MEPRNQDMGPLTLRAARRRILGGGVRRLIGAAALTLLSVATPARAQAPPCTDNARSCLESIGRLYIAALLSHDGSKLPLAPDVRRTENALTNARGAGEIRESFRHTEMVKAARDIRAYADPAQGEVVFFFIIDIDLGKKDVAADGATQAGSTRYRTSVSVPPGTYTVHEAERFRIVNGLISEIEIIAHVETGKGQGSGWPISRDPIVSK